MVVEDDLVWKKLLESTCPKDISLDFVTTIAALLTAVREKCEVDCFLLDNVLPDGTILERYQEILSLTDKPIILMTSQGCEDTVVDTFSKGFDFYIKKRPDMNIFWGKVCDIASNQAPERSIARVMRRFKHESQIRGS